MCLLSELGAAGGFSALSSHRTHGLRVVGSPWNPVLVLELPVAPPGPPTWSPVPAWCRVVTRGAQRCWALGRILTSHVRLSGLIPQTVSVIL